MDPFTLGAAGITSAASLYGQRQANKANRGEAEKNRAFQERMSNTSYQRSMADMKKAGINPLMAVNNSGASTPGGAMATMQDETGPAARAGMSSALDTRRALAEVRNLNEQNANLRAQNAKIQAETNYTNTLRDIAALKEPGLTNQAYWDKKMGMLMPLTKAFTSPLQAIGRGLNSAKSSAKFLK